MREIKKRLLCLGVVIVFSMVFIFSSFGIVFAATPIKVACIGDSITFGVGSSTGNDYPSQLGRLLGSNYTVNNYGVSSRTLLKKGDYPYWNEQAYTDSSNWLPDIVVIMLGTNDSKPQNWTYESEFLSNCEEMINHYKNLSSHPKVYINTCPTVAGTGNYGITDPVVTCQIVPLLKQAAFETGAQINDVNTATQNMPQNFPDNVHPNDTGAAVIAQTVYNGLTLGSTSAFSQIEAEKLNFAIGTVHAETCGEGGQDLGFTSTGDCVVYYNVDFGSGTTQFQARIAGMSTSGNIHVKLDNKTTADIGVLNGVNTGGWQTYTTATCNITNVTGVHDVYLVFDTGINTNWFKFISNGTSPTKYEAENGTLANGATVASDSAASGGKCIQNLHLANSSCQINNINGGTGGSKTLKIAYAANGTGTITIYVNGTSTGTLSFPTTGGWSTFTGSVQKTITLNSGTSNNVKIVGGQGGLNLDYITIQ